MHERLKRERATAEARAVAAEAAYDNLMADAVKNVDYWKDKALAAEAERDTLRQAILHHVTLRGQTPLGSHEHRCEGKCPDEDDMAIRDPLCLACLAMDFPAVLAGEEPT